MKKAFYPGSSHPLLWERTFTAAGGLRGLRRRNGRLTHRGVGQTGRDGVLDLRTRRAATTLGHAAPLALIARELASGYRSSTATGASPE